jgi:hypothetical protein
MKYSIDTDEWYPVYTIDKEGMGRFHSCDIPDELVTRLLRVQREFELTQTELKQIVEATYPKQKNHQEHRTNPET